MRVGPKTNGTHAHDRLGSGFCLGYETQDPAERPMDVLV